MTDKLQLGAAISGRCPRCGKGRIFKGRGLSFQEECEECGLKLAENDNGDGPAVFLIFILGFSLVPLALIVDAMFRPSIWFHAIVWPVLGLAMTLGMLRPARSLVLHLQYRHRPEIWDEK